MAAPKPIPVRFVQAFTPPLRVNVGEPKGRVHPSWRGDSDRGGSYAAGEVAGFESRQAEALIEAGIATPVEPS